ncbi:MAG: oligosaccharide flippase family protein [Spirochaetaceae bacterium]|nr:oligosaccharide flippase family protein [Treponema sp.]MBP3451058.1 oligosaccharide flippase family protein [Spirochaetaceae bacterium]
MKVKNKLFSNTILYTVGEVVPRIISFLMMPIFTRFLSPADYGILSYTNSVISFIYVFCTLSLNSYVLRFYFECKDENEQQKMIGNIFCFIALVNIFVLVLLNLFGPKIIDITNISVPWKPYFRLAVFNNFLESFSIIPMVYYRVKQNAKTFVCISLTRCVLQYVITFVMLAVCGFGLMSQYYGRIVVLLPFAIIYFSIILKHGKINLDLKQIKSALKFSLPLLPGAISYLALTSIDRIILERYVSLEIIGIYNIAYTIAMAMNMIIQSFYKAIEPNVFQKYSDDSNQTSFLFYMTKMNNIYNFALYVGALALAVFSEEALMIVASEKFYKAASYVPFVLVGVIFSGRNLLMGCVLTAEKRSVISGISTMLGAMISLVLNLLLIPKVGVIAAPIALSISYLFMNIFLKIVTRIKFFNNWQDLVAMLLFCFSSLISFVNFSFNRITVVVIKIIFYIIVVVIYGMVYRIHKNIKSVLQK